MSEPLKRDTVRSGRAMSCTGTLFEKTAMTVWHPMKAQPHKKETFLQGVALQTSIFVRAFPRLTGLSHRILNGTAYAFNTLHAAMNGRLIAVKKAVSTAAGAYACAAPSPSLSAFIERGLLFFLNGPTHQFDVRPALIPIRSEMRGAMR